MTGSTRPGRKGNLDGIHPDIAGGLQHLGLTAYEIRVYQAILKHPRSRVPEIARYSSVPQPKVYATVKRLIERGLCESHLGPINQYSALDPDEAFTQLVNDSAERQVGALSAVELLAKFHTEASQGLSRREGRIKMFQGRAAASRNFKFLTANAEKSIQIVARLPLVATDDDDTIQERLKTGTKVRMLVEVTDRIGSEDRASLERSQKNGAKIRRIIKAPMRMAIFDEKITILPMLDPAAGQGDGFVMLEIRNHGLSESFTAIHEMLWSQAKRF
jgi:sugar-specific transcriptional regulator TrmB